MGKNIRGSWICDECMIKTTSGEKLSAPSNSQEDSSNGVHHEQIGAANKSDVSANTPPAEETDS